MSTSTSSTVRIVTASGRQRDLPPTLTDPEGRVVGLDEDGRIVVDNFGTSSRPYHEGDFVFGLTLCHDASDKGVEDGVVCRACYGDADTGADAGNYLFRAPDGSFPGLDPVDRFEETGR